MQACCHIDLRHNLIIRFIVLFVIVLTQTASAQDGSSSPVVNNQALRGLKMSTAAEPLGAGRMMFNLVGSQYQQLQEFSTTPEHNAFIYTSVGAASYGINSNLDIFASMAGFGFTNSQKTSGLGTIMGGIQGSMPMPSRPFLRVGAQAVLVGGTSKDQINTNRADGYNYFETRSGYDFIGKLMQTFSFDGTSRTIKLHLNEAGVMTFDKNKNSLLLLSAGLETKIFSVVTAGLELNSRTTLDMDDIQFLTDPLWITPMVFIQAPYDMKVNLGIDVSLSEKRPAGQPRALEPYRLFAGVTYSLNLLDDERRINSER
jgi:hypothetical protein